MQYNYISQIFVNLACFRKENIAKYLKVRKLLNYILILGKIVKENIATIQIQFF